MTQKHGKTPDRMAKVGRKRIIGVMDRREREQVAEETGDSGAVVRKNAGKDFLVLVKCEDHYITMHTKN